MSELQDVKRELSAAKKRLRVLEKALEASSVTRGEQGREIEQLRKDKAALEKKLAAREGLISHTLCNLCNSSQRWPRPVVNSDAGQGTCAGGFHRDA